MEYGRACKLTSHPGFSLDTLASIMDNANPRKSRAIRGNAESPGFLLTKQDSSTASCMLEQTDQFGSVNWEMPG